MKAIDVLRQRLRTGDRIRVNDNANNASLHGQEGEVIRYTDVQIMVNGKVYVVVPSSLDIVEDD